MGDSVENIQQSESPETHQEPGVVHSLMDMADEAPDPKVETEPATQAEQSQWHWADNVVGEGERPDWLQSRYKSVADQAKAYGELEKKIGEFRGAPKDGYSFDALEGVVDKDDPLFSHFAQTFKELNLTQEGFERIAQEFVQMQQQGGELSLQDELKKLGPGAKDKINQTAQWIDNKFEPKTAETIKSWIQTAQDIEAVSALMSLDAKSAIPTANDAQTYVPRETVKELTIEKENNWQRYKEDENYRAAWQRRLNAAHVYETKVKR